MKALRGIGKKEGEYHLHEIILVVVLQLSEICQYLEVNRRLFFISVRQRRAVCFVRARQWLGGGIHRVSIAASASILTGLVR